jgi:hypothetical protein
MNAKVVLAIAAVALSGCGAPAPKSSAAETFALRTECGKMGEAWLIKHPLRRFGTVTETEDAKVFYTSSANRCWIIVAYKNWSYSVEAGRGPRSWPSWAAHKIWKEVTEVTETLYDAQTGADIMSCRRIDYEAPPYKEADCRYIRSAAASDLG